MFLRAKIIQTVNCKKINDSYTERAIKSIKYIPGFPFDINNCK